MQEDICCPDTCSTRYIITGDRISSAPHPMSFKKRAEPLVGNRNPLNARVPSPALGNAQVPTGAAAPRGALSSNRVPTTRGLASSSPTTTDKAEQVSKNPAVRPSSGTSQPTVSTGCSDLDKILGHQGLPLGLSLIIEESGTTDFTSVLMKAFAAQGVMHNRIEKQVIHSHVIVVGVPAGWAKELPGEYKGSSRDQKKQRLAENSSKVSVENMAEKDLKIAWRYGLQNKNAQQQGNEEDVRPVGKENYMTQFDITQRLLPGPSSQDMSFVPLGTIQAIISLITQLIQNQLNQGPGRVIRIVIPAFLNPSLYPPQLSTPSFAIPLFSSLQALLKQFPHNLVLLAGIPLDLYPREQFLGHALEQLADGVVALQPFNQEMSALIEKAYKDEPAKIQQGLVDIFKIPVYSAKGMMMTRTGEYAFKNLRKKFEIEEWGIPVEDDGGEQQQTTQNIDF